MKKDFDRSFFYRSLIICFYLVIFSGVLLLTGCEDRNTEPEDYNPNIQITSPEDGEGFWLGDSVLIAVEAEELRSITKVDFLLDNECIGYDNERPFEFSWIADGEPGNHIIRAKAYDHEGNYDFSKEITICIQRNFLGDDAFNENAFDEFDYIVRLVYQPYMGCIFFIYDFTILEELEEYPGNLEVSGDNINNTISFSDCSVEEAFGRDCLLAYNWTFYPDYDGDVINLSFERYGFEIFEENMEIPDFPSLTTAPQMDFMNNYYFEWHIVNSPMIYFVRFEYDFSSGYVPYYFSSKVFGIFGNQISYTISEDKYENVSENWGSLYSLSWQIELEAVNYKVIDNCLLMISKLVEVESGELDFD